MSANNLIGSAPYQVPTNADLGSMAFQDHRYVSVGRMTASGNIAIGTSAAVALTIKRNTGSMIRLDRTDHADVDSTFDIGVSTDGATATDFAFFGGSTGLKIYGNAQARFQSLVGINVAPAAGVLLNVNGAIRVTEDEYLQFGGTNNRIGGGGSSNSFVIQTGGTERVRINSANGIGINRGSPVDSAGFGDYIDFNGGGGSAIYFRTNNSATEYTMFGNFGADGYIRNQGAGNLIINNNGAERMRISPSGNVGIGTTSPETKLDINGNIRASAGIMFGTDTDVSNTLDDYEEDTWVPIVQFGDANNGITYSIQEGQYTKIGNICHIYCKVALTSKGTSTGNMTITGLPFTPGGHNWQAWHMPRTGTGLHPIIYRSSP